MGKKNPIPVAGMPPTTLAMPKALLVGLLIVGTFAGRGESLALEDTGEWRACVRNPSGCTRLDLDAKRLTGSIPAAIGDFTNLVEV